MTTATSTTFSFAASSSFSPTAPPPDALYYQLDTWQGAWQAASSAGSNSFTGVLSALQLGVHILYAYSTDGQDASNVAGYVFVALPATRTPSAVSVSPNPFSGRSNAFALLYSDPAGYAALNVVAVIFNTATTSQGSCYVYYAPGTNLLYLQNDSGVGATSITPGSGTLSNSQCTINGSGTSVVTSGNDLTLHLDVTSSTSFEGPKNIYMYAEDNSSANTGWVEKGAWTPSASFTPSIVSVTQPATSNPQTFTLKYSDSGTNAALLSVVALFNATLSSKNSCYVYYTPPTNLLYLQNDDGVEATSITPGSGTLSNHQCTIAGSSVSVVTSGNNLTLNLAVTASGTFTGTKQIFMKAADDSSANSGWVNKGTWTIP